MNENPFLNRGSLAGLIARRNQISTEGDSPFTAFMKRQRQAQIDEAINQFQRPRPMMPQRPMPRPMQPRPMQPQPMPQQQQPMLQPPVPGVMGMAGMGTSPGVTVTGGGGFAPPPAMPPGRPAPSFGGFWNALGLGGSGTQRPGGMPGYGAGGGMNFGSGFRGFGAQQPYRGFGGAGVAMRDPREMIPGGFR